MRILITGASGSGTSTLASALAAEIGGTHLDADDYFWLPTTPPYTERRREHERLAMLLHDMRIYDNPIVAGSVMQWGDELEDSFDLIVFLYLDAATRVQRLQAREIATLGHADPEFLEWASKYDIGPTEGRSLAKHRAWLATRSCRVVEIHGDLTVDQRIDTVLQRNATSHANIVNVNPSREPLAEVTLRAATADDALCVSVLAMQVFLDTYATQGIRPTIAREVLAACSEEAVRNAMLDRDTHFIAAEHEGHMIGFAEVNLAATHHLAPSGFQSELRRLYVQEPFTRAAVGTRLLRRAEEFVASAGATVLWLTVWVHNHRARAFYAARGYDDRGSDTYTFEGESHGERLMAKRLDVDAAM